MSENWHKRHALMLASQLPENASDANAVIRELQNLVDSWLHVGPEAAKVSVTVLRAVPDPRGGGA
jgi:hypothetical protein